MRQTLVTFTLLIAGALALGACKQNAAAPDKGVNAYIDTSSWDLSCASDDDCAVVEANRCDKCGGCPTHPIRKVDQVRFNKMTNETRCPPPNPEEEDIDCGSCADAVPKCEAGVCKAVY